jgi:hypothetical protein
MAVPLEILQPGDVIVTATTDKGGWWIRARSWLTGAPNLHNHVALFTHLDHTGRPRGLEGRPSGFGWANLEKYLQHPDTLANVGQHGRTDAQRAAVVGSAIEMVGLPYDWASILAFAATTARLPFLAGEWPEDGVPSHVVCSSAIDYLYEAVGWDNPGGHRRTRGTDPDDFTRWIRARDAAGWR